MKLTVLKKIGILNLQGCKLFKSVSITTVKIHTNIMNSLKCHLRVKYIFILNISRYQDIDDKFISS